MELAEIGDDQSFLLPPIPQPAVGEDGEPTSPDETATTVAGPEVTQIDLDDPDLAPTSITIEFS